MVGLAKPQILKINITTVMFMARQGPLFSRCGEFQTENNGGYWGGVPLYKLDVTLSAGLTGWHFLAAGPIATGPMTLSKMERGYTVSSDQIPYSLDGKPCLLEVTQVKMSPEMSQRKEKWGAFFRPILFIPAVVFDIVTFPTQYVILQIQGGH
jgi:hypothetical protein